MLWYAHSQGNWEYFAHTARSGVVSSFFKNKEVINFMATKSTMKVKTANSNKPATKSLVKPSLAKVAVAKPAVKTSVKAAAPAKKPAKDEFGVGCYVVYPTHGVGRITGIEKQIIGGHELSLYVISFEKDKMTLRVPVTRAKVTGLRPVSSDGEIGVALDTLRKKAKVARGMWSKRAQEYESKINSGNIVYLAEVVRDLHKNVDHPERSYSERVIYENAFSRLVREIAAVEEIAPETATEKLIKVLSKKAA